MGMHGGHFWSFIRGCDGHTGNGVFFSPDSRLAQCMQHVLIALGSENVGKLLTDSAQSAFEASALAEQDAGGE